MSPSSVFRNFKGCGYLTLLKMSSFTDNLPNDKVWTSTEIGLSLDFSLNCPGTNFYVILKQVHKFQMS